MKLCKVTVHGLKLYTSTTTIPLGAKCSPNTVLDLIDTIEYKEQKIESLQQEIEELRQANKNLANAAVEKPPYKEDLQQKIKQKDEALSLAKELLSRISRVKYSGDITLEVQYEKTTLAISKALGGNKNECRDW